MEKWKEENVIEEVNDEGQERLSTTWVLTEKLVDGVEVVKARLVVRGYEEEDKVREMETFANVLRRSGYTQDVKAQVIEGVMARDLEMAGKGGRYRPEEEIREQKAANQHCHKIPGSSGVRLLLHW